MMGVVVTIAVEEADKGAIEVIHAGVAAAPAAAAMLE